MAWVMQVGSRIKRERLIAFFKHATGGPQAFAFIPALILGGYWLAGEGAMIFLALGIPTGFALTGLIAGAMRSAKPQTDSETGLALRDAATATLDQTLLDESTTGQTAAAVAIGLDEFDRVAEQFGPDRTARLLRQVADRIGASIRANDVLVRLDAARFGIALGPMRRADLEAMISICARLQSAISDPYTLDGTRVFLTASMGFCLPGRAPARTGEVMLDCAEKALQEALRSDASAIRAYSPELERRATDRAELGREIADALDSGQIAPWFQPQISTDTGDVIGFTATPRWDHPEKGLIPPDEFLDDLKAQALGQRLFEFTVEAACRMIDAWKTAGQGMPVIGVALDAERLADPKLCEHLQWELDRRDLVPQNLCLEIVETSVQVDPEDIAAINLNRLAELGFLLELDRFGTGNSSMSSIRRYFINRIKIDRSYITCVDRDRDQQNMIAAILTMAERLGIATLAEGVETAGEHAMLAQLGCSAVQGLSIAAPMPADATLDWIAKHRARLATVPDLARGSRN